MEEWVINHQNTENVTNLGARDSEEEAPEPEASLSEPWAVLEQDTLKENPSGEQNPVR